MVTAPTPKTPWIAWEDGGTDKAGHISAIIRVGYVKSPYLRNTYPGYIMDWVRAVVVYPHRAPSRCWIQAKNGPTGMKVDCASTVRWNPFCPNWIIPSCVLK